MNRQRAITRTHSVTYENEAAAMRAHGASENVIRIYATGTTPVTFIEPFFSEFHPDWLRGKLVEKVRDGKMDINDVPDNMRAYVDECMERSRRVRAERHDMDSDVDNADGTHTSENGRLRVTLPTEEFHRIGRYGVFNDAMRMMGNRSEAVLLEQEPIDPAEIMAAARERLVYEHLQENCRYDISETVMRMNGGHRMSPGMVDDVGRARAYADGILTPISSEQLQDWACEFFRTHDASSRSDCRQFEREVKTQKLRIGDGNDERRNQVLADAAESLNNARNMELEYRQAIGNTCRGWKIEIIGPMPEQIGLCRYTQ